MSPQRLFCAQIVQGGGGLATCAIVEPTCNKWPAARTHDKCTEQGICQGINLEVLYKVRSVYTRDVCSLRSLVCGSCSTPLALGSVPWPPWRLNPYFYV